MARPERIDPRKFSLRSVTEAMPTPSSKTSRENLIVSLHIVSYIVISIVMNYRKEFSSRRRNRSVQYGSTREKKKASILSIYLIIWLDLLYLILFDG